MQILEASGFALRSARYLFTSADSSCSVTLFPMVHVGERGFYDRVCRDAFAHDIILVEGISSPAGNRLTRAYRWIGDRLGLVVQPPYPSPGATAARIVKADLTADEFHEEWRKIPLWMRLLSYVAAPCVGLELRWFGSREQIARRMNLEDRLSAEEVISWDPQIAVLKHGLLHARDARLIEKLGEALDRPDSGERRIAVLFGAAHMRAVIRELHRRRFRIAEAEWQTIFYL